MKPIHLAIIGATGMVGQTTLAVLHEWNVPLTELKLYASAASEGKTMPMGHVNLPVHSLTDDIRADFAILALSADLSKDWACRLIDRGMKVIDHSSAFRMEADVPLVIPEINADTITSETQLVANPNCSASVILMALAPLDQTIGLKRVIIATYQSVSGAGIAACDELKDQTAGILSDPQVFPHRIAGNLFPEIGSLDATQYTGEETKISQEIRKILRHPGLHVSATAVRVPVEIGHSAAVSVELNRATSISEIQAALQNFPGLICDGQDYSTPMQISDTQDVHVGRVRIDPQDKNWLHFWVVGDNTRKGAASNAIQVLQYWASL